MTSPRISIICATAARPNPGMASVDLAFQALNRRYALGDACYYQLYTAEEVYKNKSAGKKIYAKHGVPPLEYRCMRGKLDEIYDSDAIIFWGDFLHSARFLRDTGYRLERIGISNDAESGTAIAHRHFLLHDAPDEVLHKCFVYGGNLLFNTQGDYADDQYFKPLQRLFSNAGGVWMRDVFSGLRVSKILDDWNSSHTATDCSCILTEEDLKDLSRSQNIPCDTPTGRAGLFVGRSSYDTRCLHRFADEVGRTRGLKVEWMPWRLDAPSHLGGIPFRRSAGVTFCPYSTPMDLGDIFDLIQSYDLIITDTYHLCVNAWRMGTPAICVADCTPADRWDISCGSVCRWRDKRWVFYSMYDALDFFVHARELNSHKRRKARIRQLAVALEQPEIVSQIACELRRHAQAACRNLCSALNEVLRAKGD